ncbi:hypothetical protein G6F43_014377 [Rhizopus delemar]|nr:hypothetical protein G6F43_014377 [Rhizopus delemar]
MDEINESLRKSSLESHFSDITEDQTRTTPLHSSGGHLLAQRGLVPSVDPNGPILTIVPSFSSGLNDISQDGSPFTLMIFGTYNVKTVGSQ